ncbi:hypothetical protein [Paenibacillus sp. IITD108]|uniref:hypothetical protein n=1 Tax=Paenibacillus sp. IITD108 TaxID=3116649 RepID=UPI002F41B393
MNDKHVIIIGTGNEQFDQMIKSDLEQHDIGQVVSKINTRNILLKRVLETGATMVIVSEDLIGNDGGEEEWAYIFEELRGISLSLRIVFICDRPDDDIFLTKLTTFSIFDIFNNASLPADYLVQLSKQPEYKNIQRFKKNIQKVTEDLVRDQQEREAEHMIKTGVVPKTEQQVIKTTVPIYERLLIQPKLIVIASAYEGAGSSTFGRMFLEYLALLRLHVGLLESPYSKPSWFDYINANPHINASSWKSWHSQISSNDQVSAGSDITIKDVTYIIRNKQESYKDWDIMQSAQLVGMARQIPILFYDLSSNIDDDRERLILKQANHVYMVSSFDPVRVNREFKRYENMTQYIERDKITLICNRSSEQLEKDYGKELQNSYQIKNVYFMSYLNTILEATMNGNSGWEGLTNDQSDEMNQLFRLLTTSIIDEEILKRLQPDHRQRNKGLLRRIFSK